MESLAAEIARLERLITQRERDCDLIQETATIFAAELSQTVTTLGAECDQLLIGIHEHEAKTKEIENDYAAFLVKLKEEYEEAKHGAFNHKLSLLTAETNALNQRRDQLEGLDRRLFEAKTKLMETVVTADDKCRRLRHGKYAEAKRRLPELRKRQARQVETSKVAHDEPPPPTATVQLGTPMMCNGCGQIAKPWVMSSSGAALCLSCSTGRRVSL